MNILKSRGPNTDLCGTPDLASSQLLYVKFILTVVSYRKYCHFEGHGTQSPLDPSLFTIYPQIRVL